MKSTILNIFICPAFHLLVFISFVFAGQAQDTTAIIQPQLSEIPQILWVKQWPSLDKGRQPRNFRNRFNSIFLGKKAVPLMRPVSVLAFNQADL
ncbi:MAG: hypothetical protein NTW16_13635, partial [Bacteroidetes bacterium]|nr:hypothetical protein [Bacteroidota bacterium]